MESTVDVLTPLTPLARVLGMFSRRATKPAESARPASEPAADERATRNELPGITTLLSDLERGQQASPYRLAVLAEYRAIATASASNTLPVREALELLRERWRRAGEDDPVKLRYANVRKLKHPWIELS